MAIDLQTVIEHAVRTALAPVAVDAVHVAARPDHSEEDALYVTATLPEGTPLVGGKRYVDAMTALSHALMAAGEYRFPYLRLDRVGEELSEESIGPEAPPS